MTKTKKWKISWLTGVLVIVAGIIIIWISPNTKLAMHVGFILVAGGLGVSLPSALGILLFKAIEGKKGDNK
jgi:hypothetical protein